MTWPEGSEDPEGKASERNPDVVRSAQSHLILYSRGTTCWIFLKVLKRFLFHSR